MKPEEESPHGLQTPCNVPSDWGLGGGEGL